MISLLLLAFAFVFACLAASPVMRLDLWRHHLGWLAIALWILADLFRFAGPMWVR